MGIKIWVDDIRPCPSDYDQCCKTTQDAIKLLKEYEKYGTSSLIEVLDLDHDAGDYAKYGGDYIKIIDWMVSVGFTCPIRIHSGNPVGRANMLCTMERYGIPEYKYEFDEMF